VKRKARGENGRKSTSPGDRDLDMSGEDDAFVPAAVDAVADRDILHEFTLRPRPKPKPKKSQADAGPSTVRIEGAIDGPEESMSIGA